MTKLNELAKLLCWILLAAFVMGMAVGFCSRAQCQEPAVSAAKLRLQQLERERQQAAELADAKAAEQLEQQAAELSIEVTPLIPQPIPDEISKPEPSIVFASVTQAAAARPYFERYTASYCQPCKLMESEGFDESLKAAGFRVDVIDVTNTPKKEIQSVPQVWLRAADGTPVRRWIGYRKAADVTKQINVDGLCKLKSGNMSWSGVVIAPGFILTCAHHEQRDGFFVRFPIAFGSEDYCQLKCQLVKSDEAADLSLLRFEPVDMITVKAYPVAEQAPDAVEIPGYFEGDKPKRVPVKRKDMRARVKGIAVDDFIGEGITSPQFGMSGSPLLTSDGRVAGIQSLGLRNEIAAVSLESISTFLASVDMTATDQTIVAEVTNADASPETLAAVVAAHLVEVSGQTPQEPIVYGSLFAFDVDVPDTWKTIGQKILQAQTIEFPSAGLKLDWSGKTRTFAVASDRITITPAIKATVNKWFVTYSCGLDGFEFHPDLSSVTVLLSGAPDLTVRLK